jgi:hypothetical protein
MAEAAGQIPRVPSSPRRPTWMRKGGKCAVTSRPGVNGRGRLGAGPPAPADPAIHGRTWGRVPQEEGKERRLEAKSIHTHTMGTGRRPSPPTLLISHKKGCDRVCGLLHLKGQLVPAACDKASTWGSPPLPQQTQTGQGVAAWRDDGACVSVCVCVCVCVCV